MTGSNLLGFGAQYWIYFSVLLIFLCRCIIKFLGRCSSATGSNHSLSTISRPGLNGYRMGVEPLGKVPSDCVYILIDTSHSMTGKLDLVKNKVIQLIQVRCYCSGISHLDTVHHEYISTSHDLLWLWEMLRPALYLEIHRKTLQKKDPFANESHPFFASRSLGQWVLPVTYKLLSEFLCLPSQVCSILKSVACPCLHYFPDALQLGMFILINFQWVLGMLHVLPNWCVGRVGQVVGQSRLVLVPPVPSLELCNLKQITNAPCLLVSTPINGCQSTVMSWWYSSEYAP